MRHEPGKILFGTFFQNLPGELLTRHFLEEGVLPLKGLPLGYLQSATSSTLTFHPAAACPLRSQVPTGGLLNTVGAPHLSEASTYLPSYTGEEEVDSIRKHHTSLEVAMALKSFEEIGYPPKVCRLCIRGVNIRI